MTAIVVPSFSHKLSWAEKHLTNLESSVGKFRGRHPYQARKVLKGQNKGKWVFEFTESPDPAWALMVGDVLYNLRATLDYLAGALNPSSQRPHVFFPIIQVPIWEIPPVDGENSELTRIRDKWNTATVKMHPDAVAIIKGLQPIENKEYALYFHRLDLLNRLSNKDRHRTLHVHLSGLTGQLDTTIVLSDGDVWTATGAADVPPDKPGTAAIKNGATITIPSEIPAELVVDVQIKGTVTQAINMGNDGRTVVIPDSLWQILDFIRKKAVAPLSPYLHGLKKP